MSEEVKTEEEPSIEEILDSIRQIISEDDEEEGSEEPSSEEMDVSVDPEVAPEPEPEVESEPLDQSAIDDMDFDTPSDDVVEEEKTPEPEPEPIPEPVVEVKPAADTDDALLTGNAEEAAISAISNLVRKTAVGSSAITLEDIVRAELKPLLRAWLDKHLPTVIERLVQEELERVSKRVLDE